MSTKYLFVSIHIRNKSEAGAVKYVLSLEAGGTIAIRS